MPPIAPPPQIPLTPLKVCAARLLAVPLFGQTQPGSARDNLVRRFSGTVETLEQQAGSATILSNYLASQLAPVALHAASLPLAEQAEMMPLLARLRAAVANVVCATCAGPGGHQCDGQNSARDAAQISAHGLCLSLLRDMHHHVVTRMQPVVEQWGWEDNGQAAPVLAHQWGTEWLRSEYELPDGTPKAGAATHLLDRTAGVPLAEIRLELTVDQLDWISVLQILWLLSHELICHVLQAPPLNPIPRQPCRPGCGFYEGWMDEVARRLMQADLVSGQFGAIQSAFIQRYRLDLDDAATRYRDWRYGGLPGAGAPKLAKQWKIGVNAARCALQLLELAVPVNDEAYTRQQALRQLVALSFRIQATSPTTTELDEVVYGCLAACEQALLGSTALQASVVSLLTGPIRSLPIWINELHNI